MDITFLTTTRNGSYDRLAKRQKKVLDQEGITSEVIELAQINKQPTHGNYFIIYCTFNLIPKLIETYNLKPQNSTFMTDSALITIPYLKVKDLINAGYNIYAVSKYNMVNFQKLGIEIHYKPHFIPDPNPSGEILNRDKRPFDFITVGINEPNFDRKGHFWNWLTETMGFRAVRVCSNYCFGNSLTNLPDDQLYSLYKTTKWYLGTSHAETPHLPLIESYAFGTPSVFLSAHEFSFIGIGIPIEPSFTTVKGVKNFVFSEIDAEDFLTAIGEAYTTTDDNYTYLSNMVRKEFVNNYRMESRLTEFKQMVGL